MRRLKKILSIIACFVCANFVACGDENSAAPVSGESNVVNESSSSWIAANSSSSRNDKVASSSEKLSSCSSSWNVTTSSSLWQASSLSSRNDKKDTLAVENADTSKIVYSLKPFDGPLTNPHKGFTVPTE
ncbi:hypothetical protein IKQ19_16085, partial [Candidatus Saccharibacteria bacterium]|nr:hypothetical protein [Candidatus Saccharibacteria bacterium]